MTEWIGIRTGDILGTTKPCKVTLGRECYDCKKPGTGTLVPMEVDIPRKYEQAVASATGGGLSNPVSFMNRGG